MTLHLHLRRGAGHDKEDGYILLTLLLILALMAIVALATVPTLKFNIQRDREEEMIHRGVQYSNAIRRFYKKFGRYPTKIEDLESSNNMRFLRKRYKDPMNCKAGKCEDFKLLYFSDVQAMLTGFGGGGIAGATPVSAMGGSNGPAGSGQTSAFGQSSFGQSSFGQSSFGASSSSFGQSSFGQSSTFGGGNSTGSSSVFGQSQQTTNGQSGSDSSQTNSQGNGTEASGNSSSSSSSSSGQIGSGQIIGGPIVGVASATKDTDNTIREFNHKKKYKDWLFIYDPAQDRGFLITTPYQPQMMGLGQATTNLNGQNTTGSGTSGFGTGQPPAGMQNNPNLPSSGFGTSNQPSSPPQQQ
jgi:type II secretory pathway pseudopilin PulG